MKTITTVALAATLLTAPIIAPNSAAQITQQGGGYLIRMKFTPGTTMAYNVTTSMTMGGQKNAQPMKMSMPMTMKVVSVKSGVATIEATIDMSSVSKGAKPQKFTYKMDNQGNMIEGQAGMGLPSSASFPKNPIRVGQTWNHKTNSGGMNLNATYTLKGVKKVGAQNVAEIATKLTGSGNSGGSQASTNGTGTMLIRTSDGSLQSMSMNLKIGTGGQSGNMTMSMSRTK